MYLWPFWWQVSPMPSIRGDCEPGFQSGSECLGTGSENVFKFIKRRFQIQRLGQWLLRAGRAVAFDSWDPQFESSQRQIYFYYQYGQI